jgi:hypothetical protein
MMAHKTSYVIIVFYHKNFLASAHVIRLPGMNDTALNSGYMANVK